MDSSSLPLKGAHSPRKIFRWSPLVQGDFWTPCLPSFYSTKYAITIGATQLPQAIIAPCFEDSVPPCPLVRRGARVRPAWMGSGIRSI